MTPRGEFELHACSNRQDFETKKRSRYLEVAAVRPTILGPQALRLVEDYSPDFGAHDILIEGYQVADLENESCDPYWREVLLALCAAPRVVKQRFTIKFQHPAAAPFEAGTGTRTYRILIAGRNSDPSLDARYAIVARELTGDMPGRESHCLSVDFESREAAVTAWQNGFEVTPAALPQPLQKLIHHLLTGGLATEVEQDSYL
jgi:hypothetical protein